MSKRLKCEEPTGCINCEVQIQDSNPLRVIEKLVENKVKTQYANWPLDKIIEETEELKEAALVLKDEFSEEIMYKLYNEAADVFFVILCLIHATGKDMPFLIEFIIEKTKVRFPEEWKSVIGG